MHLASMVRQPTNVSKHACIVTVIFLNPSSSTRRMKEQIPFLLLSYDSQNCITEHAVTNYN